nr:hydrogenase formation protein HypD [candidate division Zixibacteria bacterium]
MKYLDEFRDPIAARAMLEKISVAASREWTIMEVCGGQTHSILKNGLDRLLPRRINILHGPGCPVCVTPIEMIDRAIEIAQRPGVILCSFGDMLRVPGSRRDLLSVKAEGGQVRTVYSPLDALEMARKNRDLEIVFFAIGFETTAPVNAAAVYQAATEHLDNFSILSAQVLVPPAIEVILNSEDCRVNGFLAAGHVCAITGYSDYEELVENYHTPFVITGFEPLDILQGIYMTVVMLEEGRPAVNNQYRRVVRRDGNPEAKRLMGKVFERVDRKWRGLGNIPGSGLGLRAEYAAFDAARKFGLEQYEKEEAGECISGLILQGLKKPFDCPAFSERCTPEHPLGATMVSSEGACAAYYHYSLTEFQRIKKNRNE